MCILHNYHKNKPSFFHIYNGKKTIEIEPSKMKKKMKKKLPAAATNTVVGSAQHQSSFQKKIQVVTFYVVLA